MATSKLPSTSTWRHGDVCMQMDDHPERRISLSGEFTNEKPLPLGIPVDVESDIFVGRVLIRSKALKSDNPGLDAKYFEGRSRKGQIVVQGQFKKKIPMNEVKLGNIYDEPFQELPPKWVLKPIFAFFATIRPGVDMDPYAKKPRTLFPLGSCQKLRVDKPGDEPDIVSDLNIQEETSLLLVKEKYRDPKKRERLLCNNEKAAKYFVEPGFVYTIESYDDLLDLGDWNMKVTRGVKVPLDKLTQGQPFSYGLLRRSENGATEWAYRLHFFHKNSAKRTSSFTTMVWNQDSYCLSCTSGETADDHSC